MFAETLLDLWQVHRSAGSSESDFIEQALLVVVRLTTGVHRTSTIYGPFHTPDRSSGMGFDGCRLAWR